jgi:hypothetical protein
MSLDPDGLVEPPTAAGRTGERPLAVLLSELASESALLLRLEAALLKTELQEKLGRLGQGAAALAAGGLIAYSGWLALVAAAVLGLAAVWPAWLAALVVGLVVLAAGATLLWIGKRRFDGESLTPQRTLRSLRENRAWLKERLR